MPAGKIRHRVTFRQNTPTANAAGQLRPAWSHYVTVWGEVTSASASELTINGRQRRASVTHVVNLRSTKHTRGITPRMQATFDGKTFEIEGAFDPDGRNRNIEVECKEIVA